METNVIDFAGICTVNQPGGMSNFQVDKKRMDLRNECINEKEIEGNRIVMEKDGDEDGDEDGEERDVDSILVPCSR